MASAEAENQPETLQRASVNEPVAEAEELVVSKISVLSHSSESKLSTIVEENGTSAEQLSAPIYPRQDRLEQLARPKVLHLEETLELLENSKKDEMKMNERVNKIKMKLRELRVYEKHVRQIQSENSTFKASGNSVTLYNNLQCSLRKVAFEMLAKQIIEKMPALIVKMQHARAQQTAPEMKALMDTLQATLIYYLGQPTNEHEERIFNYLCYGFAKFIENIIENVHNEQQTNERVAQDGKSGNGHFPVAVQLARKAYKERE